MKAQHSTLQMVHSAQQLPWIQESEQAAPSRRPGQMHSPCAAVAHPSIALEMGITCLKGPGKVVEGWTACPNQQIFDLKSPHDYTSCQVIVSHLSSGLAPRCPYDNKRCLPIYVNHISSYSAVAWGGPCNGSLACLCQRLLQVPWRSG